MQETRAEIARQIEEENRVIQQKEQEVMQMELLEMELIKKLQNTQAIQKQAYMDLESAIQQRSVIGAPSDMSGYRSAAARFQGSTANDANNNMMMGSNGGHGHASELDGSQHDQPRNNMENTH